MEDLVLILFQPFSRFSWWQVLIYRFYNEDTKDCNQYCTLVHRQLALKCFRMVNNEPYNLYDLNAVLHMRVLQNDHNRICQRLHLHIFWLWLGHLVQRTFLPSLNFKFEKDNTEKLWKFMKIDIKTGQFSSNMVNFGPT